MKIGDICAYAPKSQIKAGEAIDGAEYMFFTSSPDENKRYSEYQIDGEGIIMGTGGNATLHYYSGKFATSTDCIVLLPRNTLRCKYLYYYLKANMNILEAGFKGAGLKHTNKKYIGNIEINKIPDFTKQDEIILLLDKLQKIIDSRNKELALYDDLIKARFVELFGDQTANPYGWQQTSIGACCALKSGTSLPADKENEGGEIPYIKVGDMNYPGNEQYITTSSRFVSKKTAGTGIFPVGTVVFPKRGGAIGTNKKRLTRLPICADLNVMGVTAGTGLTPQYLMAYFNNIDLGTLNNGSSVPQINNKDIAPLLISVPPMKLQNQFAAFVSQIDKSKATVQKALDETQLLFDSLMQQYFG